jgi:deoxyribonuclease V
MQTKRLHDWDVSYPQAVALQKELAQQVQQIPLRNRPTTVAGLDCALSTDGRRIIAAVVVLQHTESTESRLGAAKLSDFKVIETTTASQELGFPYIPGLLSFRESPVCIAAVEKLKIEPDAFIIDGQGVAHPRRFGIASHLGLFFDKPTIGCAKSRLTGSFEEPAREKGAYSPLKDNQFAGGRLTAEVIGAAVRTRTSVKPVFVSVGNKCLLKDAIDVTLAWTTKYRLPEPTRLAHQMVSKLKREA